MRLATALIVALAAGVATPPARAEEPLSVGDEAPDFTLRNAAGEDVTLSASRGKEHVLLAFYPRDFTPG